MSISDTSDTIAVSCGAGDGNGSCGYNNCIDFYAYNDRIDLRSELLEGYTEWGGDY